MKKTIALMAAACLTATAGVQAVVIEKYEADFTSWTGQDITARSPVTSSTGHTPLGGVYVSYPTSGSLPSGCITQGSIGGTATTAKFSLPTGNSTRARFSAPLPTSMKGNDGIRVEWSARYGNYVMRRAPIQIAFFDNGESTGVKHDAFIHVDNGNSVWIQRNVGSAYSIDALSIPALGDSFHAWVAEVIVSGNYAYWDLSLDGTQLFFTGTGTSGDGSPVLGGHTYSFRTIALTSNLFTPIPDKPTSEGGSGSYGYVGLGDLNNQSPLNGWDFEFDYIRFQNLPEPASVLLLAVGSLLLARRRR